MKIYDLDKLTEFFKGVADLTLNHHILHIEPDTDHAVVYPFELGKLLEKVDPEWYKN